MEDLINFLNAYRVPAQHLIAVLLAGAIWRWGRGPEKWLIGVFLATMVVPVYAIRWLWPDRSGAAPFVMAHLVLDVIALVLFLAIALRANRNYPLWIAGFQLVALGTQLMTTVWDGASPLALVILITGPSYCQLLVLNAGFVRHAFRERRYGQYREWRVTAPVSGGYAL